MDYDINEKRLGDCSPGDYLFACSLINEVGSFDNFDDSISSEYLGEEYFEQFIIRPKVRRPINEVVNRLSEKYGLTPQKFLEELGIDDDISI